MLDRRELLKAFALSAAGLYVPKRAYFFFDNVIRLDPPQDLVWVERRGLMSLISCTKPPAGDWVPLGYLWEYQEMMARASLSREKQLNGAPEFIPFLPVIGARGEA